MNHVLFIKITILLIINFIYGLQCDVSENEENFIQNNHIFSINLYKEIAKKKNGSFIFSPFSLQLTGGLLYLGADNETASEIYNGFKLISNSSELIANSFSNLIKKYNNDDSILRIANGIFINKDYELNTTFLNISKEKFNILVKNVAFEEKYETGNIINSWVNKTTRGKIQVAVRPKNLLSTTIMMLVNAISFKGQWKQKFNKTFTTDTDFLKSSNEITTVKMMYDKRKIKLGVDPKRNYVIGIFDFKDTDIVLQIIMPTKKKLNVDHIENLINDYGLKNLTDSANLNDIEADIEIPKFITKFEINLKEQFINIGMKTMFNDKANFSKFLKSKQLLKISRAIHKSVIEINEEGVEAASFTGYDFVDRNSDGVLRFFKADQTFVYVIKGGNNEIYFMGRYNGENDEKNDDADDDYEKIFIEKNHEFSMNFYNEISKFENGSFIFSPISLQIAGGLLYLGADNKTSKEIENCFKLISNSTELIANSFSNILNQYIKKNVSIFKIANGIFISDNYELNKNFINISKNKYNSILKNVSFKLENIKNLSIAINNWVNKTTRGKINDIIKTDNLNPTDIMILINAISFKGEWEKQFNKFFIKNIEFYSTINETTIVQMMYDKRKIKYGIDIKRNYIIGEFNFKNTDIILQIIIPTQKSLNISHIENLIMKYGIKNLTDSVNLEENEMNIAIPKFITKFEINLKDIFTKMGFENMFSNEANFNNFLKTKASLKIQKALHKSIIDINEDGVEASSFTGFELENKIDDDILKLTFQADQTFLYVLKGGNDEIYFMGRFNGK